MVVRQCGVGFEKSPSQDQHSLNHFSANDASKKRPACLERANQHRYCQPKKFPATKCNPLDRHCPTSSPYPSPFASDLKQTSRRMDRNWVESQPRDTAALTCSFFDPQNPMRAFPSEYSTTQKVKRGPPANGIASSNSYSHSMDPYSALGTLKC